MTDDPLGDLTARVLDFWFGRDGDTWANEPRRFWFKSTPELDADIRTRFGDAHAAAQIDDLHEHIRSADDHLAYVLLFDQFPRNMFRGTPAAFATDLLARLWADKAITAGLDHDHPAPHRRVFFYLPFEHSENMADQERCVDLCTAMGHDPYTKYAVAHRDVIAEFGRFPHRNAILGRPSSGHEQAYLDQPGAGF
jgi:uncharacterized protein (DUF924 family)